MEKDQSSGVCLWLRLRVFPHEIKKRWAQPKNVDPRGPDQAGVCFFDFFFSFSPSHWLLGMRVGNN